MLVHVEACRLSIGAPVQPRGDLRRDIRFQPLRPLIRLLELIFDFLPVIKVVRQGGINVGQRNARKHIYDLVRAIAPFLVPDDDVSDADAVPGDARLPAAYAWRLGDVLREKLVHWDTSSIWRSCCSTRSRSQTPWYHKPGLSSIRLH